MFAQSRRWAFICLVAVFFCSFRTYADNKVDWDPEKRQVIRSNIFCDRTLIAVADPDLNDSVGIPLSATASIEETEAAMKQIIQEKGRNALVGSVLYRTGSDMAVPDSVTERPLRDMVTRLGYSADEIKIQIISVPKKNVVQAVGNAVKALMERVVYWLPSKSRNYQKPLPSEVSVAMASTAVIETPNIIFLYRHLPKLDANLTVITHYLILTVYDVWTKTLINWLLCERPHDIAGNGLTAKLKRLMNSSVPLSAETKKKIAKVLNDFVPTDKQLSLSMPFILNFNVVGKITPILNFIHEKGMAAALKAFPPELVHFVLTQGLTAYEQTMFYSTVMTRGLGGWVNSRDGKENSKYARVLTHFIRIPILWFDAIYLAKASGAGSTELFHWGKYFSVNTGHLDLVALTVVGWILMRPVFLNWTLPVAKWTTRTAAFQAVARTAAAGKQRMLDFYGAFRSFLRRDGKLAVVEGPDGAVDLQQSADPANSEEPKNP